MELMSPAGNYAAFKKAVENGADAVYLGLCYFNARKPAGNFSLDLFKKALNEAHSRNVKIYVTLNTDIKTSELKEAAAILKFLSETGADAVIVKDLGVIYLLKKYFPEMEFHLSTQSGIANSAAMSKASELGAERVVLARELNADEIKTLNSPGFPEREVFVQGSMCFSFSGRCLMSSWFGGRSANRGTCQAPCRFAFSKNGSEKFVPYFSMKDLNLSKKLSEISKFGVSALKIEGRLKSAGWTGEVTKIYRDALDGKRTETSVLSSYSGREISGGFYSGLENLITSQNFVPVNRVIFKDTEQTPGPNKYNLFIKKVSGKPFFEITTEHDKLRVNIKIKKKGKKSRGVYLNGLEEKLRDISFGNLYLAKFDIDEDIMTSPSGLKNIVSELGSVIAPLSRKDDKILRTFRPDPGIISEIDDNRQHPDNSVPAEIPNSKILRIDTNDISEIIEDIEKTDIEEVIVNTLPTSPAGAVIKLAERVRVRVSLFPVLFEKDLTEQEKIIDELAGIENLGFEVNDTGHLKLLKGVTDIHGGPYLTPYNILAVKMLKELGLKSVHVPLEADRDTLEGLITAPLPLLMTAYGRIPLFYTRAVSENFKDGTRYTDRSGYDFFVKNSGDTKVFLSDQYFSIYGTDLSFLKVSGLSIDISGEKDILFKYRKIKTDPVIFGGLDFNLNRRLS